MKKLLLAALVICLAVLGSISVLASYPGVDSDPYLFSVIKTDKSKNNTVIIDNNVISFTFGAGVSGQVFGFQPASTYYYHDLIRVRNNSEKTIDLWYTLDGDFTDLYSNGIFWLTLADKPAGIWEPATPTPIEGGGFTEAIDFYFAVPSDRQIISYSGNINFFAAIPKQPPTPPTVGIISLTVLLGLLLLAAGLYLNRKGSLRALR